MLILYRIAPFTPGGCPPGVVRGIRQDFSCLSPCKGQIAYVLLTRAPVAGGQDRSPAPAAPRLACVKPVASVHPEPGSNSSLLLSCSFFFQKIVLLARSDITTEQHHPRSTRSSEICRYIYRSLRIDQGTISRLQPRSEAETLALVLLYFVYCKSFNVLFPGPPFQGRGEKRCKVKT